MYLLPNCFKIKVWFILSKINTDRVRSRVWVYALRGLFQPTWFNESINWFIFLTPKHLLKDSNLAILYQERKLSKTCSLSLKLASWHSLACTYSKVIFLSQNYLPFKRKCPYCLLGTCPVGISAKLCSGMIRESASWPRQKACSQYC